ncbi:substrate-binding periplasmic protein [Pseudomonas sp. DC3000-4b1]|uniref:substrate-binding periplasmic protein n=1 Tax=unclassified Pseudomonas TaxID=196821 RepID=UPI003CEF3736
MIHSALVTIMLALFLAASSTCAVAQGYRVVTEEWAPYNYLEHERLTGMATDIVRAIMARTGDEFEITLLPSMRSTLTLSKGPRTIMYSLFRTAERESLYKWVGPIAQVSIFPYQLAGSTPQVNSMSELLRAPRITTRHAGLIQRRMMAQGFENLDPSAGENVQLYLMLLTGRTGIIVGDSTAGVDHYSRSLGIPPGTLRQIPVELYHSSLYIAFSKDSDDAVVARWAAALEQLRESGELRRIQVQYEPASEQ